MGVGWSETADQAVLTVKVGEIKYDGSYNTVMVRFKDNIGQTTQDIELSNFLKSAFRQGETKEFTVSILTECIGQDFGDISFLEIWRKPGVLDDGLFLEALVVERVNTKDKSIFPIHRWIPMGKDQRLHLSVFDSCLPQDDIFIEQRKKELAWKKQAYFAVEKYPGIPKQVAHIPSQEAFGDVFSETSEKKNAAYLNACKMEVFYNSEPKTIENFKNYYEASVIPLPEAAKENWYLTDEYFGEQRLTGCNPFEIKRCNSIPAKFPVTDKMVAPFLDGKTLATAMKEKRLFIVDYEIMDNIEMTVKERKNISPIALFYRDIKDVLKPIAIQLQQKPCDLNPIFLPSDPFYTWLTAKAWCNMADGNIHEPYRHLGFTHFFSESICTVTHMELSPSHPIFKLLAPHFLYLLAINNYAMTHLISPGGTVDNLMYIGRLGFVDVMRRAKQSWRMDIDGNPEKDVENRGLGKDALPHYPYRDDAIPIYKAIEAYVSEVVLGTYKGDKIAEDYEIQSWYRCISLPVEEGGLGFKGVPGDGQTVKVKDVIDIVTTTIYASSAAHAATSFNQYDQYGFAMVYPSLLRGDPPTSKAELKESDLMATLPDVIQWTGILAFARTISTNGTQQLGEFEMQYGYDPLAQTALNKFRHKLLELAKEFGKRSLGRKYTYNVLDPLTVPNSISI